MFFIRPLMILRICMIKPSVLAACLFLFSAFLLQTPAVLAQDMSIGYASSAKIRVQDPQLQLQLDELRKTIYTIQYATAQKLSNDKITLWPKTLQILTDDGVIQSLRPHPRNDKYIEHFHEEFESRFEKFLTRIAAYNDVQLILFFQGEDELTLEVKNFKNDPSANLMFTLWAYYVDSGTMEMDFVDIDRKLMRDHKRLKEIITKKTVSLVDRLLIKPDHQ